MKIMVIGAQGMLGKDLTNELKGSYDTCRRDIDDLDICNREEVRRDIEATNPDFVINCAAYTDVDGCESESEHAFAVNAQGVKHIALACNETGSVLYHISTDFVFDGSKNAPYVETDKVNPLSVYARSKLQGEMFVQDLLSKYVIIRTSWLFGKHGKNFVATIIKLSEKNDEISIVNDQIGCPTSTVELAKAIRALLSSQAQGIYHFCNAGICSWYEFAVRIVSFAEHTTRVVPISSQKLLRPAVRPSYSVMNCNKFISETGFHPIPWEDTLKEYLNS